MEIYLFAIVVLFALAVFDLMVGVSNDAVNFLNSSIGSRVAPRYIIMIIASLGMLTGVLFSSGMMEVARKGIFHPQFFLMPELITIFLAVMLTDILLLDIFNTFGLPTSTTVSIVFELLGAAVAVSLIKIHLSGEQLSLLGQYINTGQALVIISGILLSVGIAFVCGAVVQFVTRLIFTFEYTARLKRYGGLWGGASLSAITYFILIKGAKGASFISPEMLTWIKTHTFLILSVSFILFSLFFQALLFITRVNILKPIVLVGTFALAMAFAANDLVNFIGVPLAGFAAFKVASASTDPLTVSMAALQGKVQTDTLLLLLAGIIMVITLWTSRKARTVTETEIGLGRQDEGIERFGSTQFSRIIVRMVATQFGYVKKIVPSAIRRVIASRLDPSVIEPDAPAKDRPSFDLLRASVNLMVASMVVSFATSMKLPLSTTYVTFMVAMGTSLSDQAWGRESAVYRVTGVMTVVGGWFFTAMIASTVAFIFATFVYFFKVPAIIALIAAAVMVIRRSYRMHSKREKDSKTIETFSLKEISDTQAAIALTRQHFGVFLENVGNDLDHCITALIQENRPKLKALRRESRKIQDWSNIINANIFKTLYLLNRDDLEVAREYALTIRSLQEIAESHRDILIRAHLHVANHHTGLLDSQKVELETLRQILTNELTGASGMLLKKTPVDFEKIVTELDTLKSRAAEFDCNQIQRIQNAESKTRLSILFYSLLAAGTKIAEETSTLLNIFRDTFKVDR